MNILKNRIGEIWDDIVEMQRDLECELEGEVFFSEASTVPFSSLKRVEMYNEDESFTLEFSEEEDGIVNLREVYEN